MSNIVLFSFHINWFWSHIDICSGILKPKISAAVLLSLSLPGPQRPIRKFSCSCPIYFPRAGRALHPASSPVNQTGCTLPVRQPNIFHFLSGPWYYSYKPITSYSRNKGAPHPTLITTKLATAGLLCSQSNPYIVFHGVQCALPQSYECMWLTNFSQAHVQC